MTALSTVKDYFNQFETSISKITVDSISEYFDNFPNEKEEEVSIPILTCGQIDQYFQSLTLLIAQRKEKLMFDNPKMNIWNSIDIGHSELKHCSFLTWLMDRSGDHMQGALFLKIIFNVIGFKIPDTYLDEDNYLVFKEYSFGEDGRTDIYIKSENFLIIIEAKIDASEQTDQIDRYKKIIKNEAVSLGIDEKYSGIGFLTRTGEQSKTGLADFPFSWNDVANACSVYISQCRNPFLGKIVQQYSECIRKL